MKEAEEGRKEGKRGLSLLKKSIYGRDLYYPDCAESKFLCRFAGRKTLTDGMLKELLSAGYAIAYRTESEDGKLLGAEFEAVKSARTFHKETKGGPND